MKESALECLGHLVACTGDLAEFQPMIQDCMPSFVERIKNEAKKLDVLSLGTSGRSLGQLQSRL